MFRDLNVEAMVRMANALTPEQIPPLVTLRTLKDAQTEPGVDYFDMRPEGLFDTPFAIARVVRGVGRTRSMTIGAAAAPQPSPGTVYHWVVLQGDPRKSRFSHSSLTVRRSLSRWRITASTGRREQTACPQHCRPAVLISGVL